jgi:hypothetical protein
MYFWLKEIEIKSSLNQELTDDLSAINCHQMVFIHPFAPHHF